MVLVMILLLAKQIITLYHVVQKILTKDQHALVPYTKRKNTNSLRWLDISRRVRANGMSVVMGSDRPSPRSLVKANERCGSVVSQQQQKAWAAAFYPIKKGAHGAPFCLLIHLSQLV